MGLKILLSVIFLVKETMENSILELELQTSITMEEQAKLQLEMLRFKEMEQTLMLDFFLFDQIYVIII